MESSTPSTFYGLKNLELFAFYIDLDIACTAIAGSLRTSQRPGCVNCDASYILQSSHMHSKN